MAEKLSITIKLAGGEEIERQLADIGAAGQKAFGDIADAARKAGGFKNLKPEEVTAKLKEMGIVGKEAFDKISGAVATATRFQQIADVVQSIETGFAGLARGAMGLARVLGPIGIAAAAIGTKVVSAMNEAEAAIRAVDTAAIKAGMSIEKFDQLRQGFEKMGLSAQGVEQALQGIASAAEKAKIEAVTTAFKQLQEAATRGYGGIGTAQLNLLVEAAQGVGPAADAARKALTELGVTLQLPARTLADFITLAGDATQGTAAFVESLRQMPDGATRSALAIDAFKDAGVGLVQALRNGIITEDQFKERLGTITQEAANAANASVQAATQMDSAWERFKQNLLGGAAWDSVKASGLDAWNAITASIERAYDALLKFMGLRSQSPNAAPDAPGFAHGGTVGGRGTGTSDSNLAWVSRGEHIMPARAVRQPGVLALLEALRRTGGNLRGVMDGMGRFALGGVVPQLPRFADGGMVGGMQHLGTVDLRTDHGTARLMASSSAVEQLSRLAVTKRMTSTGKKPGFIG